MRKIVRRALVVVIAALAVMATVVVVRAILAGRAPAAEPRAPVTVDADRVIRNADAL